MDLWKILVPFFIFCGRHCSRIHRRILAVNDSSVPEEEHARHHQEDFTDALKKSRFQSHVRQHGKDIVTRRKFLGLGIAACDDWTCLVNASQCHCDQLCILYGDCCVDAEGIQTFIEMGFHKVIQVNSSKSETKLTVFARHSTCVELQINKQMCSFQVVTTCPEAEASGLSEEKVVSLCNDQPYELASYNSQNGEQVVFKNKFCAFCHNLKANVITSWPKSMACINGHSTIASTTRFNTTCVNYMVPPDTRKNLRLCSSKVYRECSNYDLTSYKLCRLYLNPVFYRNYLNQIEYRNYHCAICDNLIPNDTNDDRIKCTTDEEHILGAVHNVIFPTGMNFNSLFSLKNNEHDQGNIGVDPPRLPSCPENEVYDMKSKKCRVLCPYGYAEDGSTCNRNKVYYDYGQSDGSRFNISIAITTYPRQIDPDNVSFLCTYIERLLHILKERDLVSFPTKRKTDLCSYEVFLKNASALADILDGIESSMNIYRNSRIPGFHANVSLTNFDGASSMRCLGNVSKFITTNATIVNIDRMMFAKVPRLDAVVPLADNMYRIFDSDGIEEALLEVFEYCIDNQPLQNELTFTKNCSKVSYNPEDFIYTKENMSVYIISEKKYLTSNQSFELLGNKLIICNEDGKRRRSNLGFDAMGYLTMVSMSASIVSLVCLLLFHIIFKELRNIHGKCMMSFSFSLLIAHLSFVVGNLYWYRYIIMCKVSAAVQHYAWLCVFAWSNVMAFDIARRFNVCWSIKGKLNINNSSRFLKYSLFGWVVPFVFVCSMNVIDWSQLGNFLRYGHNSQCWITTNIGVIIAFGVPLGAMLIFGLVCFCISLHGIEYSKRVKLVTKNVKRDRNKCIIYTKIFILIGISWIVAYIGALTNLEFFEYMNIITNGLQGFLLFVAFLINSKIPRRIVTFAKKKKVDENNSSSGTIHM